MTLKHLGLAVLAGFTTALPAGAATYILDFEAPSLTVPQTFGDSAEADLSYRAIDPNAFGDVATTGTLSLWQTGYGDLDGALWGNPDPSHGEIRIEANDPTDQVTLVSFDMGGWVADEMAEWRIFDLSWTEIASGTGIAPDLGRLSVSPNISGTGGLIFQWGGDAWDVGVNNFRFFVDDPDPVNVVTFQGTTPLPQTVPLPAAGWGLVAGLAGLAALRRRRGARA